MLCYAQSVSGIRSDAGDKVPVSSGLRSDAVSSGLRSDAVSSGLRSDVVGSGLGPRQLVLDFGPMQFPDFGPMQWARPSICFIYYCMVCGSLGELTKLRAYGFQFWFQVLSF